MDIKEYGDRFKAYYSEIIDGLFVNIHPGFIKQVIEILGSYGATLWISSKQIDLGFKSFLFEHPVFPDFVMKELVLARQLRWEDFIARYGELVGGKPFPNTSLNVGRETYAMTPAASNDSIQDAIEEKVKIIIERISIFIKSRLQGNKVKQLSFPLSGFAGEKANVRLSCRVGPTLPYVLGDVEDRTIDTTRYPSDFSFNAAKQFAYLILNELKRALEIEDQDSVYSFDFEPLPPEPRGSRGIVRYREVRLQWYTCLSKKLELALYLTLKFELKDSLAFDFTIVDRNGRFC